MTTTLYLINNINRLALNISVTSIILFNILLFTFTISLQGTPENFFKVVLRVRVKGFLRVQCQGSGFNVQAAYGIQLKTSSAKNHAVECLKHTHTHSHIINIEVGHIVGLNVTIPMLQK